MRSLVRALTPTFRFWMQTEVHVFAFSMAANVLLAFYPFLIVTMWIARLFFSQDVTVQAIDTALRQYFPDALADFLHKGDRYNLPNAGQIGQIQVISVILLLFTANGIFEPLEVALNHAWGIRKNRSFFRNQLISLGLIFACGIPAVISLLLTALNRNALPNQGWFTAWISLLFVKMLAVPIAILVLVLIYRFLPNGKPPINRVVAAAIGVGILLEVLKQVNALVWPWFYVKLGREYGVFQNSVSLIFIAFLSSMLVLAGAEWSARGHRLGPPEVTHVD
jgi:membrane protein